MGQVHDELYEVVSNVHCRELLFALLEETPRTDSLQELDTSPDNTNNGKVSRIKHYHVTLPKLDDHDFIEWKPDMGCVERGPRFAEIKPLLELLAEYHTQTA